MSECKAYYFSEKYLRYVEMGSVPEDDLTQIIGAYIVYSGPPPRRTELNSGQALVAMSESYNRLVCFELMYDHGQGD